MSAENSGFHDVPRHDSTLSASAEGRPAFPATSPESENSPEKSGKSDSSDDFRKTLRSVAPRDSVLPRGIQIVRVPPGTTVSRRIALENQDEKGSSAETPDISASGLPSHAANVSGTKNTEEKGAGFPSRPYVNRKAGRFPGRTEKTFGNPPRKSTDAGSENGSPAFFEKKSGGFGEYPSRRFPGGNAHTPENGETPHSPETENLPREQENPASRGTSRRFPSHYSQNSRPRFHPREEPLSLAEELANEMAGSRRNSPEADEILQMAASLGDHSLAELQKLSIQELIAEARKYGKHFSPEDAGSQFSPKVGNSPPLEGCPSGRSGQNYAMPGPDHPVGCADTSPEEGNFGRQELIFAILREKVKRNGLMYGEGTLEILPDGFGFLRSLRFNYISCPDDIYVSPSQIRRFGLRNGNVVSGQIRPPKENERYFALLRVEAINHQDPNENLKRKRFDELTPTHPTKRLILESDPEEVETRVLDMMIPLGLGQRGFIVSPPQAGKTTLLRKIAKSLLRNYPDVYIFILLIDERPEEVADMRKTAVDGRCEVISSTFDEPSSRHVQVSEIVMEKAKIMVEYGRDVVILLDSITRLARASNAEAHESGKTPAGGLDAGAMQMPKRFFGNARCTEDGGSMTILATAQVETGCPLDDAIFEAFQGTGNLEIVLDKKLVEQGVWPAIDLSRGGTRRDEMLIPEEEYHQIMKLRRVLSELNPIDAMEMLTKRLRKTKNNEEFLAAMQ